MTNVRYLAPLALAFTLLSLTGCAGPSFGPNAKYGMTFYCPGAGNLDFGDSGIRTGLTAVGYKGEVAAIPWTVSLNPAIDQIVRVNARTAGTRLAGYIRDFKRQYPNTDVNIIGLSAGSGIAIWACEDLKGEPLVNNVVLLGSSLSHDYDLSSALRSIRGGIYCYHSKNDVVLSGLMKPFGTIDAKFTEGAGSVGFDYATRSNRVVNIPWTPAFTQYDYYGGHTDGTNAKFVAAVLSKQLITYSASEMPDTARPMQVAQVPQGAHPE